MKKYRPFLFGFFISLVFGVLYLSLRSQPSPTDSSSKQTPRTNRKSAGSSNRASQFSKNPSQNSSPLSSGEKLQGQLDALYGEKLALKLQSLTTDQLKQHIAYILSTSNPIAGVDWSGKKIIQAIALQMAERDLATTCQWIDSTFQPKSREDLYEKIIRERFKEQPKEALAFAKDHLDTKGISNTLRNIYGATTNIPLDNDTADFLLKNTALSTAGTQGTGAQFAKDFDFLSFGETALSLSQNEDENIPQLSVFPTNFLKEWAMRNPEAAMSFYNANLSENAESPIPFNDITDIVEGYLSITPDEQATSWLASVLQPDNLSRNDRNNVIMELTSKNITSTDILKQTIQKMNITNDQILEFYSVTTGGLGDNYTEGRLRSLKLFNSPQERISILINHYNQTKNSFQNQSDRQFKELCLQLKTLGHSEQDIAALRNSKEAKSH